MSTAIRIIAGLLRGAAEHIQIIVATQSPAFVDCFDPADIVVAEAYLKGVGGFDARRALETMLSTVSSASTLRKIRGPMDFRSLFIASPPFLRIRHMISHR